MRISKSSFSAEVQSVPRPQPNPAFRYLLYRFIDGQDALLFESNLFLEKKNCIENADEHLEQLISRYRATPRALCSAA
jgi:hypothetical protein